MKNTKENCEISKIDNTNTDKRSRANHLVDKRKNGFRYCPTCGGKLH